MSDENFVDALNLVFSTDILERVKNRNLVEKKISFHVVLSYENCGEYGIYLARDEEGIFLCEILESRHPNLS